MHIVIVGSVANLSWSVRPQMREIVADFYASRYARCLAALERWRPALELDAGLARHLPAMTAAIRERALLQYATPFSSVDLASMAAAFNTSIGCGPGFWSDSGQQNA